MIYTNKLGIGFYFRYRYGEYNKNSCSIELKGSLKVDKVLSYLYNKSDFSMCVKREKYLKIKNKSELSKNRLFKYNGNYDKIIEMYNGGYKQIEISKKLKINYSSVRSVVQKYRKEV